MSDEEKDEYVEVSAPVKDPQVELAERIKKIETTLVSRSEDARFRVAKAIRGLLGQGTRGAISPEERESGAKSIKLLADALRTVAALVDSLHELSRADIYLSRDIEEIATDIGDLVTVCTDFEALQHVGEPAVISLTKGLDAAAEVVEKSEDVLTLLSQLTDIELGVNNLGISRSEFQRLSGYETNSPVDPQGGSPVDLESPSE